MPYTVFYAKKSYIKKNNELIKRFVSAINDGLSFVKNNNENTIAKVILPQFPDSSLNDLELLVKRYKENDSWLDNSIVSEKLLQNLEDIMIDNNLLDEYVPYDKLVVNYEY